MKRVFPLFLLLFSLLAAACGSTEANVTAGENAAASPVVTVFFSPS